MWQAKQDKDTQIIIVEVIENKPQIEIRNYADKNTEDLLKEYDKIITEEVSKRAADEIIKFSRERHKETEEGESNGVESS